MTSPAPGRTFPGAGEISEVFQQRLQQRKEEWTSVLRSVSNLFDFSALVFSGRLHTSGNRKSWLTAILPGAG